MSMEQMNTSGPPSLALGGEMEEGNYGEFLGVIITDAWTKGKLFDNDPPDKEPPWQWHVAVRPTHYRDEKTGELKEMRVGGETGAFSTWARYSERANSTLGCQRKAMLAVFPEDLKLGEGKLTGLVAWWKREDIQFGKNEKTGEEYKAKQVLVPTAPASDEEAKLCTKAANDYGSPVPAQAVEPETDVEHLDAATLDTVLALVHGKNRTELQFAIGRDKNLSREVKQGLLSGKLLTALEGMGALKAGPEGRYIATQLGDAA